jgi:hypothetical protein
METLTHIINSNIDLNYTDDESYQLCILQMYVNANFSMEMSKNTPFDNAMEIITSKQKQLSELMAQFPEFNVLIETIQNHHPFGMLCTNLYDSIILLSTYEYLSQFYKTLIDVIIKKDMCELNKLCELLKN